MVRKGPVFSTVERIQKRVKEYRQKNFAYPHKKIFPEQTKPSWEYERFTCWGPRRQCCGKVHMTPEHAQKCIHKDRAQQHEKGEASDRMVRGLDTKKIPDFDERIGPGIPIFAWEQEAEELRLISRLVGHIRFTHPDTQDGFVEIKFRPHDGYYYSTWGTDTDTRRVYVTPFVGPFETLKAAELTAYEEIKRQGGDPISRHIHWLPTDWYNQGSLDDI